MVIRLVVAVESLKVTLCCCHYHLFASSLLQTFNSPVY